MLLKVKKFFARYRSLPGNVFALSLVSLLNDTSSEIIYPLLPAFLFLTLGASPFYIGLIEGFAESVAAVLKLFSGYLSDKFDKRKFPVFLGYALASIVRPFLAFVTSWQQVLVVRVTDRVGKGIRGAPRDAILADSVVPEKRGLAFGFNRAADHLGAVIGPVVAFILLSYFAADTANPTTKEYQQVFLYASIPVVLGLFVIVFFVKEEKREKTLEEAKVDNISYNAVTRIQMKNSLTLSKEEVNAKISTGEPYVIRLKVPLKEEIRFKDLVRDWVVVHSSTIDDKVLMKSDGMPTYHLANIVDDHLMQITHVIRGEEWLPSAPLHILLYKAFGWNPPAFAHLPLLLKPEGNGKLSKRDGLLGNFPIFPMEWKDPQTNEISRGFKEDGYFPEALLNFLAFLGWNPGTEQEIYSLEELIEAFSLENIHKAGARFDVNKAKWFNQYYLRKTDDKILAFDLGKSGINSDLALKLVKLMKDRVTFTSEITSEIPYLFEENIVFDKELVEKRWDNLAKTAMPIIVEIFSELSNENFEADFIHDKLFQGLEAKGIKPGKILGALRLAITGEGKGPDLMLMIEILGKVKAI